MVPGRRPDLGGLCCKPHATGDHIAPVVRYLNQLLDENVIYLTSGPRRAGLDKCSKRLTAFSIGTGFRVTLSPYYQARCLIHIS